MLKRLKSQTHKCYSPFARLRAFSGLWKYAGMMVAFKEKLTDLKRLNFTGPFTPRTHPGNGAADWESMHLVSGPTLVASVWLVIPLLRAERMNGRMETSHDSRFSSTASLKKRISTRTILIWNHVLIMIDFQLDFWIRITFLVEEPYLKLNFNVLVT